MELEETRKTLTNKAREAALFEDQLQKENDNRDNIIIKLRKLEEDNIAMMKYHFLNFFLIFFNDKYKI